MVDAAIVQTRLRKLDEYLQILAGLRKYSEEEFLGNPERYGSAERFLQLAIECVNDIGNHVVADEQLGGVDWKTDIPGRLAEHGFLSEELQMEWIKMIGFRNALVHDYADVDRKIVFKVLQERLSVFDRLKKVMAQWL